MRLAREMTLALTALIALICVSCGPRMVRSPSVTTYERRMPASPRGTVPTTGRLSTLTLEQSKLAVNPLTPNEENLSQGKTHYGRYCGFCHGPDGKGAVTLGYILKPTPTNLTSVEVKKLTDGEIYYRMLHGPGHDPVMSETVLPPYRWQIVMYVRSLSR